MRLIVGFFRARDASKPIAICVRARRLHIHSAADFPRAEHDAPIGTGSCRAGAAMASPMACRTVSLTAPLAILLVIRGLAHPSGDPAALSVDQPQPAMICRSRTDLSLNFRFGWLTIASAYFGGKMQHRSDASC